MKFETNNLKIASVRFFDPTQGILLGYGGAANDVISSAPKVVLYHKGDEVINVFDPDDKTPVIAHSRTRETGIVSLRKDVKPTLGICYVEEPTKLFKNEQLICTLQEIEDEIFSSQDFFYNRDEIIDSRMHALDEKYQNELVKRKDYEEEIMGLLYLKYKDKEKKELFTNIMTELTNEAKQYRK